MEVQIFAGSAEYARPRVFAGMPWRCGSTAAQTAVVDGFPSGQRGQTVNLLAVLSVVRIHLPPLAARRRIAVRVIFSEIAAYDNFIDVAGWSSLEARRAHNPKVASSNLAPAILYVLPMDMQYMPW